jgi:chromosome segregation ATPase
MDTLDLDFTSLADFSTQPPIFGTKVLDEISKIDSNESHEVLLKLSKAEVKISKLAAACKARDNEIARLERQNSELKSLLKSSNLEELNLQLQHLVYLNKALEQKFQESQIKIYNQEKIEKKEMRELKFRIEELAKDKAYLEDTVANLKDQLNMAEIEKNYLTSRNANLEKRLKANEGEREILTETIVRKEKERTNTGEPVPKSSLMSAMKLFQEFPLSRHGSQSNF